MSVHISMANATQMLMWDIALIWEAKRPWVLRIMDLTEHKMWCREIPMPLDTRCSCCWCGRLRGLKLSATTDCVEHGEFYVHHSLWMLRIKRCPFCTRNTGNGFRNKRSRIFRTNDNIKHVLCPKTWGMDQRTSQFAHGNWSWSGEVKNSCLGIHLMSVPHLFPVSFKLLFQPLPFFTYDWAVKAVLCTWHQIPPCSCIATTLLFGI